MWPWSACNPTPEFLFAIQVLAIVTGGGSDGKGLFFPDGLSMSTSPAPATTTTAAGRKILEDVVILYDASAPAPAQVSASPHRRIHAILPIDLQSMIRRASVALDSIL